MKKTVDVVIPSYKPDHKFDRLMHMLQKQTYPIGTILIVNTEEKFFPEKGYETWQNVQIRHIETEDFDHGGTRDGAASLLDGDLILFMTQDAVPADVYLVEKLVSAFEKEKVAAAYARQLPDDKCRIIERLARQFNYPEKSSIKRKEDIGRLGIKAFFCSDVCAMYDRTKYIEQGGFIRRTIFNEDMIMAYRFLMAGYGVYYKADAKVIHSHNYTNMQQFHRNFDLGVSQAEHPEIFEGVPSEGEGIRLVKKSMAYLTKTGHIWMIPGLFFQSASKYAGYFLGKRYKKLPEKLILSCTMSPEYWKKKK